MGVTGSSSVAEVSYPYEREADVVLRDGSTVHVRPVRADDQAGIRAFLEGLSPESITFRFFGTPNLNWVVDWSVDVDYADRFALVAEGGTPPTILAHAAYVRSSAVAAEVAFMVADAWQGQGISTILLAQLAEVADRNGIATFTAEVLPANHRMIEVFRESGFPVEVRSTPDAIAVELPTSLSDEALERFHERERLSAVAAVRSVLEPHSVAVIGASRRRGTVGGELLHNLLESGFQGAVHAVNDHADVVQSLPAYRSVTDIPGGVELAVVSVPAERVVAVARECAAAGVRAIVVISAGFAEAGDDGATRQRELVEVCRHAGIRIVGPNCLGALNTAPTVRLNATFAPHPALAGRVGFMSQSGTVGIAIIEAAGRLGVGLSSFVSVGNESDLSASDFVQYWEQNPDTEVALLYLESFGNARKFARIAPRFARRKPLLAVKSGRSAAGARATTSHTGALLSAADVNVDALFDQAGVIRSDTLGELFGVVSLLSTQPIPRGNRVAIVTNAGGPGIMCADACLAHGVRVPDLPDLTRWKLAEFLPAAASVENPIDMLASASAEDYDRALSMLIHDSVCDAILAIFVTALVTEAADVALALHGVSQSEPDVPIAAVFMTSEGPPAELSGDAVTVPGYGFPEEAARAVALASSYGRWRSRPERGVSAPKGIRVDEAAAIISRQLARGLGWLPPRAVSELLDCHGLPLVQPMAAPGVELIVGVANDPSFGPVVACGSRGTVAELIKDVSVRITPLSDDDAHEMLRELRTFPMLDGYQGAPRCDLGAIEDVLLRVSALVEAHPEIAELDLNPLVARADGATILDARIRVEEAPAPPPISSLDA